MKSKTQTQTSNHPKPRTGQTLPGYDTKGLHAEATAVVAKHIPDSKHTNIVSKKHLGC